MRCGLGAGCASSDAEGNAALATNAAAPLSTWRREQYLLSSPRKRGPSNPEPPESGTIQFHLLAGGYWVPAFAGTSTGEASVHASPALSRSGVNGAWRSRMP